MRIEYREVAKEQLKKLPLATRTRIAKKIVFYASQPDPLSFAERLTGYDAYRFRVGKDYRVIFEVTSGVMYILLVIKRERAYRNL